MSIERIASDVKSDVVKQLVNLIQDVDTIQADLETLTADLEQYLDDIMVEGERLEKENDLLSDGDEW